ncbi:TetR family transcriptional regulator [Halioglobus sp.]|nr:TetR family transcriptional regulator [Halioglobus sp.]
MPKIVDHDARREKIVEIVAEMLGTIGVERTTIREIARQSGYSRGFIEHYFKDKEELTINTIRWLNERSLCRANEALCGLSGLTALQTFGEQMLPVTNEIRNEWKIRMQLWGIAAVSYEHRREQARRSEAAEKSIIEYLEQARQAGEIERPIELLPTAHSFLHQLYGLCCNATLRPGYFTRHRQVMAVEEMMTEFARPRCEN